MPGSGALMADDENASEAARAPEPSNPAAVAVALGRASGSKDIDAKAAEFLDKQSRMLDLQMENLGESQALHERHLRLRYFGDRLRIGLQLLGIVFGVVVLAGLGALVWQAHEDHGLVIEAFSVPPDMAADGLTGQVVASRFLDKLQALQSGTASARPASSYENDWGSELKVEIPQTGLTFGEVDTLLRAKLGHAQHVTGEVFKTGDTISLTVRMAGSAPQTFSGSIADIDDLVQKAAEAFYASSQPYRYADYLDQHGRSAESFPVISNLAENGPLSERGWAYAAWAGYDVYDHGDLAAARVHANHALGFSRGAKVLAEIELVAVSVWSGHDEETWAETKIVNALSLNRTSESSEAFYETTNLVNDAYTAMQLGDFRHSATGWNAAGLGPDLFDMRRLGPALEAMAYAQDHDVASARRAFAFVSPNDDASFLQADAYSAFNGAPNYWIAAEIGDWNTALADARASDAWLEANKATQPVYPLLQQVWIRPLEALAQAKTGDGAGADALIATTPLDCYFCVRIRGQIAAIKGDWPAAEHWFAEAVRQAPSPPFAYAEWGQMRLAKGDLAGAIAEFTLSRQKGPHFADPMEFWGEALMRQGDYAGALAKFEAAGEDAPNWGRNHLMWGKALAKLERADEATAQFHAAAKMNLTPADRAAFTGR